MKTAFLFAVVGLGAGSVYAGLALGLVVTYKGTGVINFAIGAIGMWSAYAFNELRTSGDLVLPLAYLPHRVQLYSQSASLWAALTAGVLSGAVIGAAAHLLVFRPLRRAPALAKIIASVGIMLTLQALVVLDFGSDPRSAAAVLPTDPIHISGLPVPQDRLWMSAIAVLLALGIGLHFRFTTTGLATRAAAENEVAAGLAGYSPQRLAAWTWVVSSVVASIVLILASPELGLNPTGDILLVVPALAAALAGRLSGIATVTATGLALGITQSEITFASTKSWWPGWAQTGFRDAVPFLVIVACLFLVGKAIPTRGSEHAQRLPDVPAPARRVVSTTVAVTVGALLLVLTSGGYRYGVITSMIFAIIALSLVVLTGLAGQISFAQAALAGCAGFTVSKLIAHGVPFPATIILAALAAGVLGGVVGLPALRIRGAQLAVVTMALALAMQQFVFDNPSFTNPAGNPIPGPRIFGVDLSISDASSTARIRFGLIVLTILTVAALGVGNIMRTNTGRRLLAIRSNERAGAAIGINVARNKLLAFAISAILAGVGGALLGYSRQQLSADSFTVFVGISVLAFAYLGGITSVSGAVVAGLSVPLGLIYVAVSRLLPSLGEAYLLIAGTSLILAAIFNPVGVAGATRDMLHRLRRRRPVPTTRDAPPVVQAQQLVRGHDINREQPAFETRALSVRYGGLQALSDASIRVMPGQVVGLIGPNGAGKTTFLDAATGFASAAGSVFVAGANVTPLPAHLRARAGLARTWQATELFDDLSVLNNLRVAATLGRAQHLVRDLFIPRQSDDDDLPLAALQLLGIPGSAAEPPRRLTLGQRKLVGVARALAMRPSALLLDEPAAGLDVRESKRLGERLREVANAGLGLLLIEHDIALVLDTCDYIYVLDVGKIIAQGTPADVRRDPAVIEAYLGSRHQAGDGDSGTRATALISRGGRQGATPA